ncbi:MAG: HEAT repeat domain-containing protein, partial [Candidatus Obscuribacter sp.]|nr:HEAT repeat domain-containing protein [Candidatus Obscuribacter sp.]
MTTSGCTKLLRSGLSLAVALGAASSVCVFAGVGLCIWQSAPAMASQYRKADVDAEIALLHSDSAQARKQAAYHLSEMGIDAKPAIPALIELLHDPIAYGEAASALGKIGPDSKAAVPDLVACLADVNLGYDRCYAATALGSIGQIPEIAVPALAKMVASDDDATIRRLSAMALGDFGGQAKEAVGVLIEAVKTGDPEMRRDAARSIGSIGGTDHDIPGLVALLSDEVDGARLGAAKALTLIGGEAVSAVPKLVELLK